MAATLPTSIAGGALGTMGAVLSSSSSGVSTWLGAFSASLRCCCNKAATSLCPLFAFGMAPGKNREGARGRRESGVPKGARWQPKVPTQPLAAPRLQRHPKMATKSATLLRRGRSPRRGRSGANSRAPASLSTTGDRTGALLDNSAAAAPRLQRHPKLAAKLVTLLRGGRLPGRGSPERTRGPQLVLERCHR